MNGHIPFRGSHDDGLTRLGWTEILGEIYFDDKGLTFNGHFYILHLIKLLSIGMFFCLGQSSKKLKRRIS